jgi:hypothetical protein
MALAGPVAPLLSSGPIVTTSRSTEIKPSTATINKPNILPDSIMISEANVPNSSATAGLEDHFSRVPDPTQQENWLALNEARILCHAASRRHTLHTGQQYITEYFTSIL